MQDWKVALNIGDEALRCYLAQRAGLYPVLPFWVTQREIREVGRDTAVCGLANH